MPFVIWNIQSVTGKLNFIVKETKTKKVHKFQETTIRGISKDQCAETGVPILVKKND